jgi:hypothetical protein
MPVPLPSASQPVVTCYTKQAWADSWTEQPLLRAHSVSAQVAPGHASAMLSYRYGQAILPEIGSRPADSTPATITRGGLIGHYVKINVDTIGDWYGVLIDNTDNRLGKSGSIIQGTERYTAFGLTWFLDQTPILKSKVKYTGGTWMIDRVIPFNGGTDGDARKNRIAKNNYDETEKCFTDRGQTTSPAAWKASTAAEYLLTEFAPKNAAGSFLLPFAMHSSAASFLDYEIPKIDYEGQTPWQVLSRLIDRRRGLGMHPIIESDEIKFYVWSSSASSVSLPSGGTIPANPNTMTYDFDSAVNIKDAQVSTTLMSRFDQVVVLGERAGSVFTVRPQTNMEPDWTPAERNTYNVGASLTTGYTDLPDADKEAANHDFRASDEMAKVFSWWRFRRTWNARSDTDPSTGTAPYALPKINDDGELDPNALANVQRSGLRIQSFLPMRQGISYSGAAAIEPATVDTDLTEAEFLAPMLFMKTTPIRTGTSDAGWVHCERLNQALESNSSKRPHTYSVDLYTREDAPGLILKTVGKPQHYICSDQYTPNGSFEAIASGEGIPQQFWLATIYMLQDQWCRAQWPLEASLPSLDLIRKLVIRVADAYLDYIVPGTIVAVNSGELKKTALGGYLRDDRKRLKDIAKLAFAWYGQDRRILNLSFKSIVPGFDIGHLITTIGTGGASETINTVISCVTYDLDAGTTSLHTNYGEMDFSA